MSEYPIPLPWSCRAERIDDVVWLRLVGELDLDVAPELDAALRRAQDESSRVIVDLRDLGFVDSSGLHVLLAADTRARCADARLVIAHPAPSVVRLFEITGALDRLSILDGPADGAWAVSQ